MKTMSRISVGALAVLVATSAFAAIAPGPNAQEEIQEALILVEKGGTIEFTAGTFMFTRTLSLDVDGVTLKGAGMDKTIFSFKKQDAGSEGLSVTSDGVTLRDFAIEDTIGDAIKSKGADQISYLNIRTEWTGGPKSTNGAYGLYPVSSKDVLIDGCVAIGASDAGIYVGQSQNVIVRNSTAKYNVAGIEIENCYNAEVTGCTSIHNTGGILVFDLPNLPQQGGHSVRVYNNTIINNDTLNFAPEGNIVGNVPTGLGIMVMANKNVEIFDNTIEGNETCNIMVVGYRNRDRETKDKTYYPWPEGINIHHNTFGKGGRKPEGVYGDLMTAAAGPTLPDIVWDGRVNEDKVKNGQLPKEARLYIHDNEYSDEMAFVNLNIVAMEKGDKDHKVSRDLSDHAGTLPPVAPVRLPQDS